MAHAVEGRTPFLDKGVVAAAFRLPDAHEAARRTWEMDPAQVAGEEPADGAAVRAEDRLHRAGRAPGSRRREPASDRWSRHQPGVAEIAHPDKVEALFRDIRRWRHGFACWKLLFYALWHRRHILGLPPEGDVFETLSVR